MDHNVPRHVSTVVLAALLFTGIAGSASTHGAPTDLSQGVVRIVNRLGDEQSIGSGTLVERRDDCGIVLTCAHLMADGVGELVVFFREGPPRPALVVAIDEENDLASLAVARPHGASVAIAGDVPTGGASLASCGFGQQGQFLVNRGQALGQVTLEGGEPEGVIELSGLARQGDSGGPIFNNRRQLVAVIFGSDGKVVDGTHCVVIRRFLAQHALNGELKRELRQLASRPIQAWMQVFRPTFGAGDSLALLDAPPPRLTTLRGTVRYGSRTVSGAKIHLTGPTTRTATLDDEGRFVFESIASGHYELEVAKPINNYRRSAKRTVWVSGDAGPEELDLMLE